MNTIWIQLHVKRIFIVCSYRTSKVNSTTLLETQNEPTEIALKRLILDIHSWGDSVSFL